jgi:hypothetical protein
VSSDIRYPEFIKSLEQTKYPFVPTASLGNNSVFFLEGTFLDAHIYSIAGTGNYYISSVQVTSSYFNITIGDSSEPARLSGKINLPVTDSYIALKDEYGRSGGILVSEPSRLALFSSWGLGTYSFDPEQTAFCVTCQMPIPDPGVTGFRLETGEIVSGKVWFVGDDGVVFNTATTTNKSGQPVTLMQTNVVGDPLFLQKLCNPDNLFVPVNPIRTIRVINNETTYDCLPDDQGNFNLQMNDATAADAALRIRTTAEGILFEVEGSNTATATG